MKLRAVLRSLSIRRKLILLLLLSIALVLTSLGLSLNLILGYYHERKARQEFAHLLREVNLEIDSQSRNLVKSVGEMARREEVIASANMISRYARRENYDPKIFDGEKAALADETLRQAHASEISSLGLYDASGALMAFHADPGHLSGFVSYDALGEPVVNTRTERDAWRPGPLPESSALAIDTAEHPRLRRARCCKGMAIEAVEPITRPMRDGSEQTVGYVQGMKLLGTDFILATGARSRMGLALVFEDGTALGDIPIGAAERKWLASAGPWDQAAPEVRAILERPDRFLGAVRMQLDDGTRVHLVASVTKALLKGEAGPSPELLLLLLACSVLLIVPTGAWAARRMITEPVQRLLTGAEAWARGDFSRRVAMANDDELGRLAHAFNAMAEALKVREEALIESEGRYRTLMDSLPHGAFFKDTRSVYRYCNTRYAEDRGLTQQEIIGRTDYDLYPKELAERYRAGDAAVMQAGALMSFEEPSPRGDKVYVIHTTKTPVWDANGGVVGVIGIYWDITERKSVEDQLRQAAVVFESTAEGVIITNGERLIIAVNNAFTEITGFTAEEAIGEDLDILRSDRHDAAFEEAVWRALAAEGRWQGEMWCRRKNGEVHPVWMTITVVRNGEDRIVNYVAVFSDISVIKRSEAQLDYLAHHDPLTDLPNRLLFSARLEHALERARRHSGMVAVLFLDLDRFKYVNDTLGHPSGDVLLKSVAERLRGRLRESDTVARVGGDEFIVTVEEIAEQGEAGIVAAKLLDCFAQPFELAGKELHLGVSIGISCYPQDGADAATLVKNADAAMYLAKEQGRNTYCFYTEQLGMEAQRRFHLEGALRHALERGEVELFYQPQMDLASGRVIAAEALLRWRAPEMGLVLPERFIPLAEETGLILPIGQWALRAACAQFMAWRARGIPLVRMAVNLSGVQIERGELLETVRGVLAETGMPAESLELEITESVLMHHRERAGIVLEGLRAMGVELALDDFGTGYSSLSYLKRFPLDALKIDKSFVGDICSDASDAAISRAIIALAQSLQLRVTAEGVETDEQRQFLLDHGCSAGQGYLFSEPLPAADFEAFALHLLAQTRATPGGDSSAAMG